MLLLLEPVGDHLVQLVKSLLSSLNNHKYESWWQAKRQHLFWDETFRVVFALAKNHLENPGRS
jgi:hypothetical protein